VFPLTAQQYARLTGRILDTSEGAVPEAAVAVVNEETGFRRSAESQQDGVYTINSLQPGVYRVTVRKQGFRTVIRFGIRLDPARPIALNFTLPVGSMRDTITVEGSAPLIAKTDPAVATVVPRNEIERLPLNGRGVLSLLEMAPGTVATPATRGEAGQFTANGQRPNANYFTVDGVSANTGVSGGGLPAQATGGALPGMSAYGSMDSLISMEALDEFRVQTSTSPADFGRLPGASVSLTSRAGSSDFHGSAVYRFRDEHLSANDWFANRYGMPREPLRLHNFAQSLGGPVARNRTFFFLSYEGMRMRQPYTWLLAVPSLAARATAAESIRPVLSIYPEPNGPELGQSLSQWTGRDNRPASLNAGSVRVDHALTGRVTLFGRYHDAPSFNEFGNTQINRLDLRAQSLTVGADLRPRPNSSIDVRFNASRAVADANWTLTRAAPCALNVVLAALLNNAGSCDDFVRFTVSGAAQLVSGSEGERRQTQYQVLAGATLSRLRHNLKFGGDYRRLMPRRQDSTTTLSVIADSVGDLADTRNLWTTAAVPLNGSTVVHELSLWAHDTWQISSRLSLSAGLRWEYSPAPTPEKPVYFLDYGRNLVLQEQRELWPATFRNFAPRLGLAWRPTSSERTVLRAGAGLYYDSSLSVATDTVNGGPLGVAQHLSGRRAPFSSLLSYGFVPDLVLPTVVQWSVFLDHAITQHDAVSLGYVGSIGRDLIRREMGGPGSTPSVFVALATNHGSSEYHGLQAQYRRRLTRGTLATVSYAWSHALDDSSSDALLQWSGSGLTTGSDHAASDFDLRHTFSTGFTYEPGKGWAVDGILRARSGFPLTVLSSEQYIGISLANAFRPNYLGGPVWVDDPAVGGGRRLNPAAFRPALDGVQGNLGRNAIAGFGMAQLDMAVRREFRLRRHTALQLRLEAFNLANHANFGDPVRFLNSPLFGRGTSMLNLMLGTGSPGSGVAPVFQNGGPRSLQAGVRLSF
jgi:hypothetical protein